MPPTYRLLPGTWSDVAAASDLYVQSFDKEPLLDYMFPTRHTDPEPFHTWIVRRFRLRYWTSGYVLTMAFEYEEAEDEDGIDEGSSGGGDEVVKEKNTRQVQGRGRAVGFTWWHRPAASPTLNERWLTPYAWLSSVVTTLLNLHSRLFPIPSIDAHNLGIYDRVFRTLEPELLNSPRRRAAWYLSSLGVDPAVQGRGVGDLLVRDGLRAADRAGVATWLVGLRGLERYYDRFGFVEVARANVGELKDWEGGAVMFRGE